jgi:hypothetical protein
MPSLRDWNTFNLLQFSFTPCYRVLASVFVAIQNCMGTLVECSIELLNDAVSDTTGVDSSNEDRYIIINLK